MRMFGAEPSDWKIVSVNDREWHLQLDEETIKKKELNKYLSGLSEISVRLDRQHGDALRLLEVKGKMFGTDRWEVQDYIQFQGVWFPKVVVLTTHEGTKDIYTLESVGKTASEVLIDLPIGTRVRDWRHLGREALKQALEFLEPDKEDAPRPYLPHE